MSKVILFAFAWVLLYYALCLLYSKFAPLSQSMRSKMKTNHAFSRAWNQLFVFPSSSDWFIALFMSVLVGQSNYCTIPSIENYSNIQAYIYFRISRLLQTGNNRRLGTTFDFLDPRLSLICQVDDVIYPCKICGGVRYTSQDPFIR